MNTNNPPSPPRDNYEIDLDDFNNHFLEKLNSCKELIKTREQEIQRLSLEEIECDKLGDPTVNFDTKRVKLEKFVAKKYKELDDVLQRFFHVRKDNFQYFDLSKTRSEESKFLAKKINAFLNDFNPNNEHISPQSSEITQLAQTLLSDLSGANVEEMVRDLAEEAVTTVRKTRMQCAKSSLFKNLPPDPADSDPELLRKLMENQPREKISSDDIIKSFSRDSRIYSVEDDVDDVPAGDDDVDSDSDETDESESEVTDSEFSELDFASFIQSKKENIRDPSVYSDDDSNGAAPSKKPRNG